MGSSEHNPFVAGTAKWREREAKIEREREQQRQERAAEYAQLTGRATFPVMSPEQRAQYDATSALMERYPAADTFGRVMTALMTANSRQPVDADVIANAIEILRACAQSLPATPPAERRVHGGPVATAEGIARAVAKVEGTAPPPLPPAGSMARAIVEAARKARGQ